MTATDQLFIRRRGRLRKATWIQCPHCGYKQYEITKGSRKDTALELTCASCGWTGPVHDVGLPAPEGDDG